MNRPLWPSVGIVFFCLIRTLSAAESPWDAAAFSAKPADLLRAASASPAPKDADIEMLYEEVSYQFDAQGRQQRAVRRVFRYLTEKSIEDWSCTEAEWAPGHEEKPAIRARVVTPDGIEHWLEAQSIGEAPIEQDSPNLLSDTKLFRGPLPAIQVGAVVEDEVVNREVGTFFAHGTVERVMLVESYPTRKLRVIVEAPAALPLRYEVQGQGALTPGPSPNGRGELQPVRTEREGRVRLVFETGPTKAMTPPEPFRPPQVGQVPQLVFSTGKSWADVAAGYTAMVEKQLDLEAVKPLVREAVGPETDREKIAAKLLALIHAQIRYTGLEFGKAAIEPHTPRETLARHYGDCKDQAALLVAMLRAAGVPAHVALLRAGPGTDVVPTMPGMGDFDHAIVYVPGQPPLWIDPSARYVPAGQLPLTDRGRLALVAEPLTKDLVRVPLCDYHANASSETVEITLSDACPVRPGSSAARSRVQMTVTGSGSCDEDLRDQYAAKSGKELRKMWREQFKHSYHTQALMKLDYGTPQDLSKPFQVVAEAADARVGQAQENEVAVSLHPDALFDLLPDLFTGEYIEGEDCTVPAERKLPLVLPEPHVRQIQFRVTPPLGFVPQSLPASEVKQFGPATISQQFDEREDHSVVATFRLDTGPGNFTATEVNALRQGIAALGTEGDLASWEVKLGFEHGVARHLAAGRVKEALAECRRLVARQPQDPEQHRRYSQVLLQAGLGDAAREEARKTVELNLKSAAAHANLARVLTYDLLGQHFAPGMDWAGAAAAYRQALDLDPAEVTARMDYAILLEHNEAGTRYAADARLTEAAAQYRAARKQLGPRGRMDAMDINLALVLLRSQKYDELEELAAEVPASHSWNALRVAAIAAGRGAAAARRKASEIGQGRDERRTILATAVAHLRQAGLAAPAAELAKGEGREGGLPLSSGEGRSEGEHPGVPVPAADKSRAAALNNRAWSAVVADKVGEPALADAIEANEITAYDDPASLHTLAAVYAELGKTADALENLRRAVQLRGRTKDGDWYVLGRIAEQYGLADAAAALYAKIPRPKTPATDDVYALAQRRLLKLKT